MKTKPGEAPLRRDEKLGLAPLALLACDELGLLDKPNSFRDMLNKINVDDLFKGPDEIPADYDVEFGNYVPGQEETLEGKEADPETFRPFSKALGGKV